MIQNQFVIHDSKQKPLKLRAHRMANYVRGQIVEATDDEGDLLYLFYYQGTFLTAKKTSRLRRHSFIENAFKHGMTFNAPHPFIHAFVNSNQTSKMLTNKQLLRKLNQHYTKQEKAYILTFFESFISKKQLFEEIKSMFYEFRRDGQLFKAYQLIRIMKDFAPQHSLVKSLSSDLIYKDFNKMYYNRTEEMFEKDRIEAEKVMFHQGDMYVDRYMAHLEQENRLLELMVWQFHCLSSQPNPSLYTSFESLLLREFNDYEAIQILELLSEKVHLTSLNERLLSLYLSTKQIDKVSIVINEMQLDSGTLSEIAGLFQEIHPNDIQAEPPQLQQLLLQTMRVEPGLTEDWLKKYISSLLPKKELSEVCNWLEPFREQYGHLEVIQKFDQLYDMSEDMDHMQSLGELYFEFRQYQQAIECFSMESELKPEVAKPLKWLSKSYLELGMKEESEAYQKMYVSVQKQA